LVEGDNNTAYFHSVANGGKRKTTILSLDDEGIIIEENEQLKTYITEFYKNYLARNRLHQLDCTQAFGQR
jgi:hypothetical protein